MDIKNFLNTFFKSFDCYEENNGLVFVLPNKYSYAEKRTSFFITEESNGGFTISDRGQTLKYLEDEMDVDLANYSNFINKLCKQYEIKLENKVFTAHLASFETNQTMINLLNFLGAMQTIANIAVLEN